MRRIVLGLLGALMLFACSEGGRDEAHAPARVNLPEGRPAPLLLISIDGFRHDYRERAETPNLDRLVNEGVTADGLVHVFPTKTFTAHWSIVTGLHTEHHGVVANNMWDPERERSFSLRNRDAVMDPSWYDGEPIWRTAERQGLTAATFFWPGSEAPVGGAHATHWKAYDASIPHEERIEQVLAWLDLPDEERPDFITLYFSRVDSLGHRHGPDAPEVTAAIADIDADLGRLLRGLEDRGLLGAMHVLVTSDHGMSDIDPERYIWLDDYLSLGDVHVSDWGPAAQIWAGDLPADGIVEALEDAHPRMRVWKRENTPYHYHFADHPRIAHVLAEADHGWMIASRRNRGAILMRPTRGMHGWDPLHREMHGIFIGHGPAFDSGARLPAVRSIHLHELMAHLLGIEAALNDGDLATFGPALTAPPAGLGAPPPALPVVYGDRMPDRHVAVPLAGADLAPGSERVVLSGTLAGGCDAPGDCELVLEDGERRLAVAITSLANRPAGNVREAAVVSGRLQRHGDALLLEADRLLLGQSR